VIAGTHKLAQLHPYFSPAVKFLLDYVSSQGINVEITSGYRSEGDQARVCAATAYPCARPGTSAHQYGLAVDMVAGGSVNSAEHKFLRVCADYIGFRPIIPADPVHFEHPAFRTLPKR
jgi:hypothetical protein